MGKKWVMIEELRKLKKSTEQRMGFRFEGKK